jgi:GTP-binding protein HflX
MFVEAKYDEKTWVYISPREILINDTIWFIRELPPKLIDAFKSTLEDSIEADLLLHVIDCNDSKIELKIKVVDEILETIWANQKKIYVFNKSDFLSEEEYITEINWEQKKYKNKKEYLIDKYSYLNPVFISATNKDNIEQLKEKIINSL